MVRTTFSFSVSSQRLESLLLPSPLTHGLLKSDLVRSKVRTELTDVLLDKNISAFVDKLSEKLSDIQ